MATTKEPKFGKYSFVYYDADGFAHIIADQLSGYLKCDDCNETWCDHIEVALRQRDDKETVWEIFDKEIAARKLTHTFMVPISPKNYLWAEVACRQSDIISTAMTGTLVDVPKSDSLGFFNRGDGRLIMRQTVLDWFMGFIEDSNKTPECLNAGHGFHDEMTFQNNLKDDQRKWFEFWCCHVKQTCITCFHRNLNIQFTDDLVPQDDKPKFSDGGLVPF